MDRDSGGRFPCWALALGKLRQPLPWDSFSICGRRSRMSLTDRSPALTKVLKSHDIRVNGHSRAAAVLDGVSPRSHAKVSRDAGRALYDAEPRTFASVSSTSPTRVHRMRHGMYMVEPPSCPGSARKHEGADLLSQRIAVCQAKALVARLNAAVAVQDKRPTLKSDLNGVRSRTGSSARPDS